MNRQLHIVCLDAPSPPDYGGAIDMYEKIKALSQSGIGICLHYFNYNDRGHAGLEPFCQKIFVYRRKTGMRGLRYPLPYIVSSRMPRQLIERLNQDNHPVLLEGIHCSGLVPHIKNKNRRIVVRMHNDEAAYYGMLAKAEKINFKKFYFLTESWLLKKFQRNLSRQVGLACISTEDLNALKTRYGFSDLEFIPGFLPWQTVQSRPGSGSYTLYHGNLKVAENSRAALWLIRNVFSKINIPFVIAGQGVPAALVQSAAPFPHIRFVDEPNDADLQQLIREAHINVLPSCNHTGVKFKMLHALFEGRFCIANDLSVKGSQLESIIDCADTPADFIRQISYRMSQAFSEKDVVQRKQVLQQYDNKMNAEKLSSFLYSRYQ